jgi:hypothetical protein
MVRACGKELFLGIGVPEPLSLLNSGTPSSQPPESPLFSVDDDSLLKYSADAGHLTKFSVDASPRFGWSGLPRSIQREETGFSTRSEGHSGVRFSRNALTPSLKSSVVRASALAAIADSIS